MASINVRREAGKSIEDVRWEAEELEFVEKANGPAAASIIGAGIGVFFLGLFTTMNEISTGLHDWLIFDEGVGPLSGKTIMAVVLWLASWALLAAAVWRRNLPYTTVVALTSVFLAAGFIGTFPKFFELFAD
jgi:hypothetical protein